MESLLQWIRNHHQPNPTQRYRLKSITLSGLLPSMYAVLLKLYENQLVMALRFQGHNGAKNGFFPKGRRYIPWDASFPFFYTHCYI